jgi:hypothetical protein
MAHNFVAVQSQSIVYFFRKFHLLILDNQFKTPNGEHFNGLEQRVESNSIT